MEHMTDRELLEAIYEKVEASEQTVHKIHSRARRASIFAVLKWVVYLGLLASSYYYIQNHLGSIVQMYTGVKESSDAVNEFKAKTSSLDVQSVLDLLGR